jgi:hypothetical protein
MATVVAGKYELLEVLRDTGVRTCRARQVTLGHILMVHFIPSSQRGDDFALLDRLAQLPESARKLFFDAGEHDSVPYVVSWPLPEFDSLPAWLDRTLAKKRPQSGPAGAVPKTQSADPGEFSRLFFKGMKEPAGPPLKEAHAPQNVKEAPVSPQEPGEFTRLFESPAKVQGPAKPAAEPLPAPASKQAAAPAPLGSGPGEFTRFFQQGDLGEVRRAKPAEAEIFPPAPPFPSAGPSLGTADVAPPASRPPLPRPPAAGPSPMPAPAGGIPPVPRPPAVSPGPAVADDYDKVMARAPAPPLPPPAPVAAWKPAVALPPPPQLQRPAASAYLPMWITLAVLFVLAVALTLFLALSR